MSVFEELGGTPSVYPIIRDFVERMRNDVMIGFFFWNIDAERLVQREFEFTARFLGADVPYSGRPIRAAHGSHPIMGGHFDRRRKILEETLIDHGVPEAHREQWLTHVDRLRSAVTKDARGECVAVDPAESRSPGLEEATNRRPQPLNRPKAKERFRLVNDS
ncbi:MAG: group 1 truncated hemoglobin [Myxococcota bacterium]